MSRELHHVTPKDMSRMEGPIECFPALALDAYIQEILPGFPGKALYDRIWNKYGLAAGVNAGQWAASTNAMVDDWNAALPTTVKEVEAAFGL